MESNCNKLYDIENLANSLGIKIISFLIERQNTSVSLNLSEQYISLFEKTVKEDKDYYFHDERLIKYLDKMFSNKEIDVNRYKKHRQLNTCHIKTNLSVAPNGDVYKCNFINEKPILNINDNIPLDYMLNKINTIRLKGCDLV